MVTIASGGDTYGMVLSGDGGVEMWRGGSGR